MTDFAEWQAARTRVREFLTAFGEASGERVSRLIVRTSESVSLSWDDLAHLVRYVPTSQTGNPVDVHLGSDEQVRSELAELRDYLSLPDTASAAEVIEAAKAAERRGAEAKEWFEVADELANSRDLESMRWSREIFQGMFVIARAAREMADAGVGSEQYAKIAAPEDLPADELRVEVFPSKVPWHPEVGPSAWPSVRLTHIPTGVAVSRAARTELQAKGEALSLLTRRVRKHLSGGKS